MDKIKMFIELDRSKNLDDAIFMLLEAHRKCNEGFSLTATDRIEIALDKAKKVSNYLDDSFYSNYPTAKKMIEDDMISKSSLGLCVGDAIVSTVSAGYTSRLIYGVVKEILDNGRCKMLYYNNERRQTVTRHSEDYESIKDMRWNT